MKTVSLRREQIHTGSLILVNAPYPYHEDAKEHPLLAVDPKAPQVLLEAHAAARKRAIAVLTEAFYY